MLRIRKSRSKKFAVRSNPSVDGIAKKLRPKVESQPTPEEIDDIVVSQLSKGGLVLVEKINEPFDAIHQAYELHNSALTEIPKKL